MIEELTNFIKNPEMRDYLQKIVAFEEKTLKEYETNPIFKGLNQTPYWEWSSIPMPWNKVKDLLLAEIVEKFGKKYYILKDRGSVKKALDGYKEYEEIQRVGKTEVSKEIPQDLFDIVVGYDDIKNILMKTIKADSQVNILLTSPPALGKSVLLWEIERLPNSLLVFGGRTRKVGLEEQIFNNIDPNQRAYIIIDELDKMDKSDFSILLGLGEEGRLKVDVHGKHIDQTYDVRLFGACNVLGGIPPEIQSRFMVFHIPEYNKEDYIKVVEGTLIRREGRDEEFASFVANQCYDNGFKDVRDAIRISRLSDNKEEAMNVMKTMIKYGG